MNDHPTEERAEGPSSTPADPTVHLASAEPRIFGAVPPTLALCLGVAGMALGIVLLASGSVVAGAIWLAAGASLFALAIDSARRWPASALPRVVVKVARAIGRRLGVVRVSAGAWSDASRQRIALRREHRDLGHRREAEISNLGAAAYREDDEEMRALRKRIAELDRQIERCEQAMREVVEHANERVQRKRAEARPTQPFAVPEVPPSDAHATTRTTPTVRRAPRSPKSA